MKAAAYVKEGRVCILGVESTPFGPVPFAVGVSLDAGAEVPADGPISLTSDTHSESVKLALSKADRKVSNIVAKQTIELAAEDLVERARAGDQNAMGILTEIGQNAARQFPRAVRALQACQSYIRRNPERARFSGEPSVASTALARVVKTQLKNPDEDQRRLAVVILIPALALENPCAAVVSLADGDTLLGKLGLKRIKDLMSEVPPGPARRAFRRGIENPNALATSKAQKLGAVVGRAWRLQRFRLPDSPASTLSSDVGWELD